jgi:L-alanine-DL-glutamate epimerase-like enolase superfamily enzyme
MRLSELSVMIVRLPLRKEFKHASFTRKWSDNLIVRCRLADGTIGWGEGVPRPYVTGETPEGAMEQLAATDLCSQLGRDCHCWSDVIELCDNYHPNVSQDDPRGCLANAHRCAVELSILDAFGKLFQSPLSNVTLQFPAAKAICGVSDRVQFSSAISSGGFRKEMFSSLAMRLYGFQHCKVKVGMNPDADGERLRRIRFWVGPRMDLRVDANEAWRPAEVVERIGQLEPHGISCVEQPVAHKDVTALSEVRKQQSVPIMLDESLTSLYDAEVAVRDGTCDLFNIRLSKCGGFLGSLRLAALAHDAGLGYQLGCHPGESGILSAAGRHFVTTVKAIRYREGSADRHLVKDRLTHEDLTFGRGGWAPALDRPGLGITMDESAVDRLTLKRQTFLLS